jgi:hypothetical protein
MKWQEDIEHHLPFLSQESKNELNKIIQSLLEEEYDRGAMEATNVCNLNMKEIHKHHQEEIEKIIEKWKGSEYMLSYQLMEDLQKLIDTN